MLACLLGALPLEPLINATFLRANVSIKNRKNLERQEELHELFTGLYLSR
jgi:hypothetical protein